MGNLTKEAMATLKKGEGRALKAGGPWIYDNEIASLTGSFENGDIILVQDFDGYPMGAGFISLSSKIRIRMLTRSKAPVIDEGFFHSRLKAAWEYRKTVLPPSDLSCCRIIFGEADFLPGLVVDKYADVLVAECLSFGMDRLKEQILADLKSILLEDGFPIRGIYERSDAPVRKKEGLLPFKGFMGPAFDTDVEITENGVRYLVDVVNGQKTGFFLDQKHNRLAMQRTVSGLRSTGSPVRVLDCFTHMGTFALNCALAGADEVTGLDISDFAIAQAKENARRNGLGDRVRFLKANVLDELPALYEAGERYDVVILDPPAFAKAREATKNAAKGYREINQKGLRLIRNGGFLATCSCSHFMTRELFAQVISQAAASAHRRLKQVEYRTQSPDHPFLWTAEESFYLKFFIFQVLDIP